MSIIPAIVILILNLTLWFFIKNYTKTISTKQFLSEPVLTNASSNLNVRRNITKSQKSHYFTIIMLGIWLLFTTIPYNTLTTYYWISELRLINAKTRLSLTIQGVSSAFFNLNHCFNIIIYTIFHKDFRLCFRNLLIKVFNLNPVCLVNMSYFKSKRARNAQHDQQRLNECKHEMAKLLKKNSSIRTKQSHSSSNIEPADKLVQQDRLTASNCSLNDNVIINAQKYASNHSIEANRIKHGLFIPKRDILLFRLCWSNKTKQSG